MKKSLQTLKQTNNSFKELSEFYEVILENLSDGIQLVDKDLNMIWVNRASDYEGIPKKELIGMNVKELIKVGYYSDAVSPKVLAEKKTLSITASGKNGKEMLLTGVPLFKGNEVDKIIVHSRDITRLTQMQKGLLEARNLVDKYEIELRSLKKNVVVSQTAVFKSASIKKSFEIALTVAQRDTTVLLTGESGVGKGVIGQFIHENSLRKDQPLIKIDCASIPEHLLESELFGYVTGAFTGAAKNGKMGLFQAAHKGTIILDEIGELPLHMQAKILRVVQERKVIKVGDVNPIEIDIRIIAMTNKDLKKMVENKEFREDLFYRLNVVPINIPSIRDRKEDIIPLVLKALSDFNTKYKCSKTFSASAIESFLSYDWPGNVREIENVTEMLLAISTDDEITIEHMPDYLKKISSPISKLQPNIYDTYESQMNSFESELFSQAYNKLKTIKDISEVFNLDRSTVRKKLKKYNIK